MLKVLLIQPNFKWSNIEPSESWRVVPYNLCLLASVIEDYCNVRIIDAALNEYTEEELFNIISKFNPDFVGITALFDSTGPSLHKTAAITKQVNPEICVIAGGVYPTTNAASVMQDKNLDYVVVGEGEHVIMEIINNKIPEGVWYRESGRVVQNGRVPFIADIDSLPLPAYHLIDYERYINFKGSRRSVDSPSVLPGAIIVTSRGCPVGCSFCQVNNISGHKFRGRSAENVIEEIRWLKETYGIRSLSFNDDNLLLDRQRAVELFTKMIEYGLTMPWKMAATALFKLDEELVSLMKRSGCEYACIAVESGNERILKEIINKPVNLEKAKHVVKLLKEENIFVTGNFIIGFPTETWDEIRHTIKVAEEMELDYMKLFTLMPLKNTKIWELCEQNNCFRENFDIDKVSWNTGQIKSQYFTPIELTILRAYEWDRINFSSAEKISKTAAMMGVTSRELLAERDRTIKSVPEKLRGVTAQK